MLLVLLVFVEYVSTAIASKIQAALVLSYVLTRILSYRMYTVKG